MRSGDDRACLGIPGWNPTKLSVVVDAVPTHHSYSPFKKLSFVSNQDWYIILIFLVCIHMVLHGAVQGMQASLELLPMWAGVDSDVALFASGDVLDDDGEWSGGQSLGAEAGVSVVYQCCGTPERRCFHNGTVLQKAGIV